MKAPSGEDAVSQLVDRQQIHDCVLRYCRGVDRFDRDLVLSAYHPDARDFHGPFEGDPVEFVAWAFAYHSEHQFRTQHSVLNHYVELDGDVAHTETYWICTSVNKAGDPLTMAGGRYVDRFERRHGQWRIATRVCVHEWRSPLNPSAPIPMLEAYAKGVRSTADVSYQRPLRGAAPIAAAPQA